MTGTEIADLLDPIAYAGASLADVQKEYTIRVLERFEGNRTHTARTLGVAVRTLQRKLSEWGVQDREANH